MSANTEFGQSSPRKQPIGNFGPTMQEGLDVGFIRKMRRSSLAALATDAVGRVYGLDAGTRWIILWRIMLRCIARLVASF